VLFQRSPIFAHRVINAELFVSVFKLSLTF